MPAVGMRRRRTRVGGAGAGRRPCAEHGSQTIEWIGIGAVVVALAAAVLNLIPEVGAAIAAAIDAVIEQLVQGA